MKLLELDRKRLLINKGASYLLSKKSNREGHKNENVNWLIIRKFMENWLRIAINHFLMLIVTWQLFTIDKNGTETSFT